MLPALSFHFGLRWADIEDMPPLELEAYLDALWEVNRGR